MKKPSLLIMLLPMLVCAGSLAQIPKLSPRLYRDFVSAKGLVRGVDICARGTPLQVKEAANAAKRCAAIIGPVPYSRLIVPQHYVVTELSSGRFDMSLLTLLFTPWWSRDFTQGYAIDAADDVIDEMLKHLPEFASPENRPKRLQ